jgi:hypothetical protein
MPPRRAPAHPNVARLVRAPAHRAAPLLGSALAAALFFSCQSAPLEGRSCPCTAPYECCPALQICLSPTEICVDLPPWPTVPITPDGWSPIPMDQFTVFAFSQVDFSGLGAADPEGTDSDWPGSDSQVLDLKPDMVIRGWGQWRAQGTSAMSFINDPNGMDNSYVALCHQPANQIAFMGGGTATALFDIPEIKDQFDDFATRNASRQEVGHDDLNKGEYRASLANPAYRDYLVNLGELQIDQGVDGLQYSEVNADFQGSMPDDQGNGDGNEGFDDYHLADFNAFLLAKYPTSDYHVLFGMTDSNILHPDIVPGDLTHNFNYRNYLHALGLDSSPFSSKNLLKDEWGKTKPGEPVYGATTFVDTAEPYRYWKDVVTQLRGYAATKHPSSPDLYISANGLFPFVDFISWGIYDGQSVTQTIFDFNGGPDKSRLNGGMIVKAAFIDYRDRAALVARGAPIVVYLDGTWSDYHYVLSAAERNDFWRIYAAEAYANGLFFAFLLKPPPSALSTLQPAMKLPTATMDGTMDLFKTLARFYRAHADLYHHVMPSMDDAEVAVVGSDSSTPTVMVAMSDQFVDPSRNPPAARRIVHVVNHDYDPSQLARTDLATGIVEQNGLSVTIPVAAPVAAVSVASPDFQPIDDQTPAYTTSADGKMLTVTLPSLKAYDVIVVSFAPAP